MPSDTERQAVEFHIDAEYVPYQGIAVIASLNEESETILNIITFGDPPSYHRLGMLQAALDRERDRLRDAWG